MAFRVRKSPASQDPRDWHWLAHGFVGAVPPYKWLVKTEGALFPFGRLNEGIVPPLESHNEFGVVWLHQDLGLFGPLCKLSINTFEVNWDNLAIPSVDFVLHIASFVGFWIGDGAVSEHYPNPILPRSITVVEELGGTDNRIPNPVVITPLPWWAEDSHEIPAPP